jgi:oligopeptide transport system permease protein
MLPNITPSILILLGLQLPNYLLFESFLSFLGVGVHSPSSSWGILLQEGWRTMSVYPHLLIFPALVLFLTVLSLNVVFDFFRAQMLKQIEAVDLHQ